MFGILWIQRAMTEFNKDFVPGGALMPSFLKISTLNSSFVKLRKRSRPAHETQPFEFPLGKLLLATTVSSSATSSCCCCCCCSGCRSCCLILGGLWCRKWWRCTSRSKSDDSLLSSWAKAILLPEGIKRIVAASSTSDNHSLGCSILKTCVRDFVLKEMFGFFVFQVG